MADSLEDRIRALEERAAWQREQPGAPVSKDFWDKLSALSTVLSGVLIASIGIWVNHSLTVGQQRAQDAQASASTALEKAHNDTVDRQADAALTLQAAQAASSLAFQKQQAADQKQLEQLRLEQQKQQAADTLAQEREHDQAAMQLQQAQLAKDFLPQMEAGARSRAAALQLLATVNPREALILSETYSVTSGDASLVQTSAKVISQLKQSADPAVSRAAADVQLKVAVAQRIQAISNVFEGGKVTRRYNSVLVLGGDFLYGGFIHQGEELLQVVNDYCNAPAAVSSALLKPYLLRMQTGDSALLKDPDFKEALISAGSDPAMQLIQDNAYEQRYWKPLQAEAGSYGLKLPLSIAVVYDTGLLSGRNGVHSFGAAASAKVGSSPAQGADERAWTAAFLAARQAWYDNLHPILRATGAGLASRLSFFGERLQEGNWNLDPPMTVHGVVIAE